MNNQTSRYKYQENIKHQKSNTNLIFRTWLLIFSWLLMFGVWSIADAVSGTTFDPSTNLYNARSLGMGGVSVAFSNDANGVFSNPAGLAGLEFPQYSGSSRKILADQSNYSLFGWAIPTDWGTFGVGYSGMGTEGSLPTKLDPANSRIIIDPSREAMSYSNSVVALAYSKQLAETIALGFNYKFFNQSLSGGGINSGATGNSLDLGATFKPRNFLTVAANLQNVLGGSLSWTGGTTDKIGGYYKLGAAVTVLGSSTEAMKVHPHRLDFGLDYNQAHDVISSGSALKYGFEYYPHKTVALRLGSSGSALNYGVGLINGGFRFDYAYAQNGEIPGDNPHYFSLSYIGERVHSFARKLKQKKPLLVFHRPKDRFITDQSLVAISAEAIAVRQMDEDHIYTVTAVSETRETRTVYEFEDLIQVSLNGTLTRGGTLSAVLPLGVGRNVFRLIGYTTPEAIPGSGEVKVLRFMPFADTAMDHWAIEPIALSVTLGLVKGYPDSTFKPQKGITRAELVTLLVRSLGIPKENLLEFTEFEDVPSTHWAAPYVAYGASRGMVTGYPDKTFKPSKVLSRAEAVTILTRYSGLAVKGSADIAYTDLKEGYWANKYVSTAKKAGMLQYIKTKEFKPSEKFTRAEACEVLYRTPQVKKIVDQWWETGVVSSQAPTSPKKAILTTTSSVELTTIATVEVIPEIITGEAK